jgi:hypothetical protein
MKIFLRDFSAKVGRDNIFKPTIRNESLHKISNENGVRVVYFATSKNLIVKEIKMFPHPNTSLLGHLLMERRTTKLSIF